jgi:hypothetical protein
LILTDANYFLWEFNARMELATKGLLDHITFKPDDAARRTAEWEGDDLKAVALIARMLSPVYQSMIREARSALEAWEILRVFFVKQSLNNGVQLRKQLHEFSMSNGENLMEHVVRFDDLCARLAAVGEKMTEGEKIVILLGSLPSDYDSMVRIIEARDQVSLLEVKEMLRREYEGIQKREVREVREVKEQALKSVARERDGRRTPKKIQARQHGGNRVDKMKAFQGECYECKQRGHKKKDCPKLKGGVGGEFVLVSATGAACYTRTTWLLDSGASSHMTGVRSFFTDIRSLANPIVITVANGERLKATGIGTVQVRDEEQVRVKLTDVLYVSDLNRSLLSISALTAKGGVVEFYSDHAVLSLNGECVGVIPRVEKLFAWSVVHESEEQANHAADDRHPYDSDGELWHARLGHVSQAKVDQIIQACDGIPMSVRREEDLCGGCAQGRMTTSPFARQSGSEIKTSRPFEIVHSDVMGPMKPKSKGGAQYVLIFVDDYSRYVHVYPLKSKSEVFDKFREYKVMVETQYGYLIRCIRTDNGGEYTSKKLQRYATERVSVTRPLCRTPLSKTAWLNA